MENEKILVINPGSTSTKIAVYKGECSQWSESIPHSLEELSNYTCIYDQLEMRKSLIQNCLEKHEKLWNRLPRSQLEEATCPQYMQELMK